MTIDAEAEREASAQEPVPVPDEGLDVAAEPRALSRFTLPAAALALLVAVLAVIRIFGVGPAVLLLAAIALLVVVGFLFRAVQAAAEPHEDEDAKNELPPTLAEEQKRAALRALKDLEFEKSVGNINAEDYEAIVARYRQEAKRAMRAVDDERRSMRERAEKIAKKAIDLEVSGATAGDVVVSTRAGEAEAARAPIAEKTREKSSRHGCPKCGVGNDDDARFCKGCGATLGEVST